MSSNGYLIAGLLGWTALFLAVGLWPFRFQWPRQWRVRYRPKPINGSLNFVSFMPFGLILSHLSFVSSPIVTAGIFCLVLSLSVELLQQFLPTRYPSVADVILNTMGGIAGACVALVLGIDGL